jgi:hypothetical protein
VALVLPRLNAALLVIATFSSLYAIKNMNVVHVVMMPDQITNRAMRQELRSDQPPAEARALCC